VGSRVPWALRSATAAAPSAAAGSSSSAGWRWCADGSAIISAQTSDLWQARQILLRYRKHCRVLESPELIELMRERIERMARMYRTD
jgi:hypothetical protein